MRKLKTFSSYQVSERVVLRKGDIFNATGGPYYNLPSGKLSLADTGPFVFLQYCERGADKWIEAVSYDDRETFSNLYVGRKRRSPENPYITRAPYRVTGKTSEAAIKAKRKRQAKQRATK